MEKPRISWQVLEETYTDEWEYVQYKKYIESESCIPGETIEKTIQVWNNYLGLDDVQDAIEVKLILVFKNYEDNFLLNLINIEIEELATSTFEIDVDRGVIDLGNLSGIANSGSQSNNSNYKTIKLKIGPIPQNIKNELKNLYFYLEYQNE